MDDPIITYGAKVTVISQTDLYNFKDVTKLSAPALDLRDTILNPYFPVWNQGNYNICSPMHVVAAIASELIRKGIRDDDFIFRSTQYNYYFARKIGGLPLTIDTGVAVKDCLQAAMDGVASAQIFPWNGDLNQDPSQEAKDGAKNVRITSFKNINITLDNLKACLNEGHTFIITFNITDFMQEWFSAKRLMQLSFFTLPLGSADDKIIAAHAVLCLGYDDKNGTFLCRNSWGPNWGDNGYFFIDYLTIVNPNVVVHADFIKELSVK